MSWTNLFKSKPAKATPDPRLRWFGKLPTYGDYYSSATDEDWTVEFHEWVLKGIELLLTRRQSGSRDLRIPSAAGIVRLPRSATTVLASVQDFGGDMRGRPFPLCFYVGLPSALWPGPTSDRVLAALRVLRDLTALRAQVVRFMNVPGRFENTFGGHEIDLTGLDADTRDGSWLAAARAIPLADWWAVARDGVRVDDLHAWLPFVSAWGSTIASHESEGFGPTLRFPLAMSLAFEPQVAGWLRWIEPRMKLEQRFLSLLVCKDPTGDVGRLSVIARELVSEDFLLLTPLAEGLAYVDDACALGPPSDKNQTAAVDLPVLTDGKGPVSVPGTWAELVEVPAPK